MLVYCELSQRIIVRFIASIVNKIKKNMVEKFQSLNSCSFYIPKLIPIKILVKTSLSLYLLINYSTLKLETI